MSKADKSNISWSAQPVGCKRSLIFKYKFVNFEGKKMIREVENDYIFILFTKLEVWEPLNNHSFTQIDSLTTIETLAYSFILIGKGGFSI